ncbi:carcinoembryonic antigen-related cell adhesion molecule 6-like isoform X1 [Alosa sapidissima]|uniref:carcinoembryonic antigen-related cell adhesion molecule 6-like isoform X1 n=1 Tax=Alosa sapidissima TaxID=34773 RepID=UPI001C0A30C3|nr:carcinoembryonic antigen-related cell adhesion molecule 6-like isoform X1 [Alosa sapidissima]
MMLHATLVITLLTGLSSGQQRSLLIDGSTKRPVGDTMQFFIVNPPSPPYTEISWSFQGSPVITHLEGSDTFGSNYSGRVQLDGLTGSLKLHNLTLQDSGEYIVTIKMSGGTEFSGRMNLTALNPVSVSIVANETEPIEFRSTVKVTCIASGSFFTVTLFGETGNMSSTYEGLTGKVKITDYKEARRGMRPFACEASNDVTGMVARLPVNVLYGPDEAVMVATPKGPSYRPGSYITLSCSSESYPAAQYQWALNGTLLGREGPELRLENVQDSESGGYSCWASNSKTGRKMQSNTLHITVPVSGLSGGGIAGIVIGSLLAVAALIVIVLVLLGFRFRPVKGCYRRTSTGD